MAVMAAPAFPPEPVVGDLEAVLQEVVAALPAEPAAGVRGRPRVVPAEALWAGRLVAVLRGCPSQLALWRLLSQEGLWHYPCYPVSDQALYARLARAGSAPLEQLFAQVTARLATRLAP